MKKVAISVLSVLAVMIMCVCFSACSSSITGTYKFESMSVTQGSVTTEIKAGEKYMGMVTLSEDTFILTINDDNTIEFKTNMGEEVTVKGTWEKKDGKYYLTIEGDSQEVTISGNKLTMESDGAKLVLKK